MVGLKNTRAPDPEKSRGNEQEETFRIPAHYVNRFNITTNVYGARIAFLEEALDGSAVYGRSAVAMSTQDFLMLADAMAKIANRIRTGQG